MADRGRDLKFSILSDVDQFDTDKPAKGLEDLADAADLAGDAVDRLSDTARRSDLDRLHRDAKDGQDSLEDLERGARDTARGVDTAFDKIAKSSRANVRQKLDEDTDHAKHSLKEVGEEAQDTGREMAASFSGSTDDILGAVQELAANAGVAFGPIGGALSVALGAGLGTFFANWTKKKEQLTQDVQDFTAALVEGQGKLSEEFLNQRIAEIDPKKLKDLAAAARDANLGVTDVIRAYAGDPEAIDAVNGKLDKAQKALRDTGIAGSEADPALATYGAAVSKVRDELGLTTQAMGESKTAYELMRDAMQKPTVPTVDGSKAIGEADNTRARVERALKRRVNIPIGVDGASVDRATQAAWLKADAYFRRNPITIRTKGPTGQRPIRDVP